MERDLNFKKLVKMLIRNLSLMILGGIVCATGLVFFSTVSQDYKMVKKVYLVFDMQKPEEEDLTVRKNSYFDAYQNLYKSNLSWTSEELSQEEKSRVGSVSVEVANSMYTITVTLPDGDSLENDEMIFDKLIQESENWMKEKYRDDSLSVEILSEETIVSQSGDDKMIKAVLGFVVGAVLVAGVLFVIFVSDKKIRTIDDVNYYLNKDCLGIVEKNAGINDLRECILLSESTVWGITGVKTHTSKTKIAQTLSEKMSAVGKKVLYISMEPKNKKELFTRAVELDEILEKELSDVQKICVSDWSKIEQIVYSSQFERFMQLAKSKYDCVIVDVVSLKEDSISKKIISLCDDNILGLPIGELDGEDVVECVDQLSKLNIKMAGVALSKMDAKRRIVRF